MSAPLAGKVAIVTGAGRNIGKAIALSFARSGADVVVVSGSRREEAEAVAGEIAALGRRSYAHVVDITRSADVDRLVGETLERSGRVDVLVNNAAIRPKAALESITDEEWARVLAVDLSGAFYAARAVAPAMKARRAGAIINISGAVTVTGAADAAHVVAAKAGLEGLTKALAVELGPFGIRANTVLLSAIETVRATPASVSPERVPLRRRGTVAEVAEVCTFLASDAASFVTGQTIGVTGGNVLI